jgi:PAS domain S-box-containing protein
MRSKLTEAVSNAATALVVLAVGSVLSAAAAYWMSNQIEREAKQRFERAVTEAHNAVESRIRIYSDVLLGARGLFIASDSVSRREFRDFVDSLELKRRYPGIVAVHYAHRIAAVQKQAFEAAVRKDTSVDPGGYPDFMVKPPGDRPEYVVVQYIEPFEERKAALGLDQAGEAVRLAALERTRDSNRITASGNVALALDPRNPPGFLMRLPVYRKGMPLATVAQRREAFVGMVGTAFIIIDLMRGVLSEQFLQQTKVRIHDAGFSGRPDELQPPTAENLMFDSDSLLAAPASPPASNDGKPAGPTSRSVMDVGGRRWNLYFSARQERAASSDRWLPAATLLGGLIISLLLFGLMRSLATVGRRATMLAASITEDLRQSEARLARAQRMTQELIEVLPNPVYFKGVDGRYLGVNKAWEAYFGMPRQAFLGNTVHDLYPDHPEVAARLHADDQLLWDSPGIKAYETSITTPDGKRHDVVYYKATFTHADGSVAGLIGTVVDITERKQAEEARAKLAAIVENSNDAIFSRTLDGTTLSWNAGAEKMLGYTAAEAIGKPIAFTLPPDRPPNLARNNENLLRGEVVARESNRITKDGRVIDVLTSHSPIRDAAGNIVGASVFMQDITALKQAQAAAQASEERFRATFDQAAVGIAHTSFEGNYLLVNQKLCDMLGYREYELVGRAAAEFTHPDDRETGRQYRQRMWEGKLAGFTEEKRYLRKDGSVIWTNRTVSLARDASGKPLYFIRVIEDITERKEAEELYRATFENAPVGIMHTAIDGYRILRANRKLCEMLGYTQDELLGMTSTDVVHPDYRFSDRISYRQPILDGERQAFASERKFIRKDGSSLWVNRTVSVVRNAAGEPLYFIRIVEDISERRRADEARSELEVQLREAQKLEAVGTLAGGIAHDFNNILGAIIGNAALARQDVGAGHRALVSLDEIYRASQRAKALVQQILAFSRKQPQQLLIQPLRPVVEDAVKLLRATLPAGVEIATACAAPPLCVLADTTQIQQVLLNLCTNAWHAMEGRAGRIEIRLDEVLLDAAAVITLSGLQPGRHIRLGVSDNGSGMDAATQARIFEPFFTTKAVDQGTGLGLSVVHGIIKAHHGAITLQSAPGEGATFQIYFPAVAEPPEALPEPAAPGLARGSGQHVLYVDDDEAMVFLVTRMLEGLGYRVSGYERGADALEAVRAGAGNFDLAVTDFNMPGLSGLEVAQELARIRPALPVVITSGYITEELRTNALRAGVRHVVYKPNTIDELCQVIQRLLITASA